MSVLFHVFAAIGVTVQYSGYISDILCYDKCVVAGPSCNDCALDKTNVITAIETHTVHCIRDVQVCIDSGYYIAQNSGTKEQPSYRIRFKLDSIGNKAALNVIRNTATKAGLQVTAIGDDDGSGYLRGATVLECISNSENDCDGHCVGCEGAPNFPLSSGTPSNRHTLVIIHGTLLLLAWAFIAPTAYLIKHNMVHYSCLTSKVYNLPLGFVLHGSLMLTAVLFTIVGVGIALHSFDHRAVYGHLQIGVLVLCLAIWQPLPALFCRPAHGNKRRPAFNRVHRWGGFLCLILGGLNTFLGFLNYKTLWDNCNAPNFLVAVLVGLFGCLICGMGLEWLSKRTKARATTPVQMRRMTGQSNNAAMGQSD